MCLFDQSGVTEFDPYSVHALFVNIDNMWMERFGNYDCLVQRLFRLFNDMCSTSINSGGSTHNLTQFFHFNIRFCRKAPVSELRAHSPTRVGASQGEILDPPLISIIYLLIGTNKNYSFIFLADWTN